MNNQIRSEFVHAASLVTVCVVALILAACSKQTDDTSRGGSNEPASNSKSSASAKPTFDDMPVKLCKVLNELAPQAPQLSAIGTQTQLVMSIASAFDANAVALQRVSADIDIVATASCPASREALLKVLKMKSLQEAVR